MKCLKNVYYEQFFCRNIKIGKFAKIRIEVFDEGGSGDGGGRRSERRIEWAGDRLRPVEYRSAAIHPTERRFTIPPTQSQFL